MDKPSLAVTSKKTSTLKLKGIVRRVYKKTGEAINDYEMIKDRDRVLVGVSGGKDSLTLLKVLLLRRHHIPIDFEVKACFVDVNFGTTSRSLLEDYFKKEDIPYIIKDLHLQKNDVNCFWCSWNKRKILFETAREHNCNKVALAHHLDDIVETILMNIFFQGQISSMRPKVDLFLGALSIIRPFSYLEKRELESFYSKVGLVDTKHVCPYAQNSKRELIKATIRKLERQFPSIKTNIFRSLKRRNIKEDYLP